MALGIKLIGYAVVFAVGVATPFAVDGMVKKGAPYPSDEPPYAPGASADDSGDRGVSAASIGAPHIRQRLWWCAVADVPGTRRGEERPHGSRQSTCWRDCWPRLPVPAKGA